MWIELAGYVLTIILGLGVIYKFNTWKKYSSVITSEAYCVLMSIWFFLISGLRGFNMGADTPWYIQHFKSTVSNGYQQDMFREIEIGYKWFEFGISLVTSSSQIFLLIIAGIVSVCIGTFIYENSKNVVWSFLGYYSLFFWFYGMTGIRQTLAAIILLFSYRFIKNRNLILFIVCIVFAYLFHKSAVAFAPMYFLANKKLTKKYIVGMLMGFILCIILRQQILSILTNSFVTFAQDTYYSVYENTRFKTANFTVLIALLTLGALLFKDKVIASNAQALHYYNAMLFALLVSPTSLLRIVQYYSIFMIFLIPEVINEQREEHHRILMHYGAGLALILLSIKSVMGNSTIYPYYFFWQR